MAASIEAIRRELDHPVIDGDGHLLEYLPVIRDFIREEGGEATARGFDDLVYAARADRKLSPVERHQQRAWRRTWWGLPARNTLDRATATVPQLMYQRLDEFGIDHALLFPTLGLSVMLIADAELRRSCARACNRYYAEVFGSHRDRMEPVAIIPTHTPEEAVAELDVAVGELGLRAVVMAGTVVRPLPGAEGVPGAIWVDTIAHDSIYDYDAVWRRCTELGVAPAFHAPGYGYGTRASTRSYVFNHIGNFGAAQEAACRSIVLGGVAHRFPDLRFAFLEGGVAWAATLCADLIGHFEKRNVDELAHLDPRALDRDLMARLIRDHGSSALVDRLDRLDYNLEMLGDPDVDPDMLDEFADSGITGPDDVEDLFSTRLFFGCEADDPMTGIAFDRSLPPAGRDLRPIFASDIGHWDVPDALEVLPEAWELVEGGQLDANAFRAFAFSNAVDFWTSANPDFFAGTVIADEVAREVARPSP